MQPPVTGLTVAGALERQLQPLILKASESWRYKMSKTEEKVVGAGAEMESSVPPRGRRGTMRGAVLYGPGDVRFEERAAPTILEPTDAVLRISATCVCGSDLWPYRGIQPIYRADPDGPRVLRHRRGGRQRRQERSSPASSSSGRSSPRTTPAPFVGRGYQSRCVQAQPLGAEGAQAPYLRVPLADGTLVATPDIPPDDLVPSLLAASDVLGTGWFAADAAAAGPGKTVAVVGDGAVGLLGVLSAKQMGAERIIAMSRHEARQQLAREFGATDIVTERGDEGVARIKDMTDGLGAHSVIEAVGTQESMMQAIRSTRPGGHVGFVGVAHGVELPGDGAVLRRSSPARRPCSGPPLTCPS